MTHSRLRHDPDPATAPPTKGPSVVAPNSPMLTRATDHGSRPTPNRVINGGKAAIIISPVVPPWSTRPIRKSGIDAARATIAEPTTKVAAYPRKSGRCTHLWASCAASTTPAAKAALLRPFETCSQVEDVPRSRATDVLSGRNPVLRTRSGHRASSVKTTVSP